MGKHLAETGPLPDRVLCSSAARTIETWDRLRGSLASAGCTPPTEVERSLYLADPVAMLDRIHACESEPTLLLIAHNPGTEDLARLLAGQGDEDAWHRLRQKFPTAALATLSFDVDTWSEVTASAGTLLRFVVPRDLPGAAG